MPRTRVHGCVDRPLRYRSGGLDCGVWHGLVPLRTIEKFCPSVISMSGSLTLALTRCGVRLQAETYAALPSADRTLTTPPHPARRVRREAVRSPASRTAPARTARRALRPRREPRSSRPAPPSRARSRASARTASARAACPARATWRRAERSWSDDGAAEVGGRRRARRARCRPRARSGAAHRRVVSRSSRQRRRRRARCSVARADRSVKRTVASTRSGSGASRTPVRNSRISASAGSTSSANITWSPLASST